MSSLNGAGSCTVAVVLVFSADFTKGVLCTVLGDVMPPDDVVCCVVTAALALTH